MSTVPSGVLRHLCTLMAAEQTGQLDDAVLLDRFCTRQEAGAFEALVRRHGGLVLGVCRRVLHNSHDAEDAFQATFLVLARKAASISKKTSLSSWLYQVAYRLALRARTGTTQRQRHLLRAPVRGTEDPLHEITGRELLDVLDEELQRLPSGEREVLVRCFLQGQTRDEAARQLGWSVRTVKRRVDQARERLRRRLLRRGVELPAALLVAGALGAGSAAALPPLLVAATVQASVKATLAGTSAAALAASMAPSGLVKVATASAALLLAGLLGAGALLLSSGPSAATSPEPPAMPDREHAQRDRAVGPGKATEAPIRTVQGRVSDADGKPMAAARVVVVLRHGLRLSSWENWAEYQHKVVAQTKTDADGRFRLEVKQPGQGSLREISVVAMMPERGLSWQEATGEGPIELCLTKEQMVRGRLVDLQGAPAAGVRLRIQRLTRKGVEGKALSVPEEGPALGLETVQADAQGRFTFRGLGPDLDVRLAMDDARFLRFEDRKVDTGKPAECENLRLALSPGHWVEGRVLYADTRKPVPHARLHAQTDVAAVSETADEKGRFRIALFAGKEGLVSAMAPPGEPYLRAGTKFAWGEGAVVRKDVELVLPRGVKLRGRVIDAGSGKPVAGAYAGLDWHWGDRCRTDADGRFSLITRPGKARLVAVGPTPDYIPVVIGSAGGSLDRPVGDPMYFHAAADQAVEEGKEPAEITLSLRRGVTLRGRIVGPDGKPVPSAVLFISGHRPPYEKTMHPIFIRGGQFELPGCDPHKKYSLLILEHPRPPQLMLTIENIKSFGQLTLPELLGAKDRHGAVVTVAAGPASQTPVEIRLEPCGSVKLRFRDANGKPLANYCPWVQLQVTPGPTAYQAVEQKTLASEVITLVGRYPDPKNEPCTDADGLVTIRGLIPGATYLLKQTRHEPVNEVIKEFTAPAGKTSEVDVTVKEGMGKGSKN